MASKEFKLCDLRRFGRYEKILGIGKGIHLMAKIVDMMDSFSRETIYYDCRYLKEHGYLEESKAPAGRNKQMQLHYSVLIKKFDRASILPMAETMRRGKAEAKGDVVVEPNYVKPAWLTIIKERHVPKSFDKPRSRSVSMGSSMNTVMW
jgi:hypothetical protein